MKVYLDQIMPGRFQPRQTFSAAAILELAESIQEHGLLYPLLVFKNERDRYELLGGERRWRASCALALLTINEPDETPLQLVEAVALVCTTSWPTTGVETWRFPLSRQAIDAELRDNGAEGLHLVSVVDNFQRQDLSPLEEGQALRNLLGLTKKG